MSTPLRGAHMLVAQSFTTMMIVVVMMVVMVMMVMVVMIMMVVMGNPFLYLSTPYIWLTADDEQDKDVEKSCNVEHQRM